MIIAIDAGGSFLKAALIHPDGRVDADSFTRTPAVSTGTKQEVISALSDCLVQQFCSASRLGVKPEGIVFGYPGPFDYSTGTFMMKHKYKSMYGISIMPEIGKIVADTAVSVSFYHDAHTFAYGEYLFGAGKEAKNMLCVTMGTGIGAGYLRNGVVMTNNAGGPHYSIYQLPLATGILEDIVSARGITSRYCRLRGIDSKPDPKEVHRRAVQGDPAAIQTYCDVGNALGQALRDIIDEAAIDVLVLGGQIAQAHRLIIPSLTDAIASCLSIKRIVPAKDIDYSSLRGAAALLVLDRKTQNT